jgi:DNA polymerase
VSPPVSRDELVEWIRCLGDIGVRDLKLPTGSTSMDQEGDDVSSDGTRLAGAARLGDVREVLGNCTRCKLHQDRKNIVFGVGDENADLMFIGEGPGADEDEQGEPFVGRAGRKLTEMIKAIGYEREQVYIANIVKCRPPGNRDPQPDEVETCSPFLFAQIRTIAPKVIVTLGSPATKTLLESRTGITRLRGRWHDFQGIPLMPTFHPAYLLRRYTVENRTLVFNDLKAARARVDEAE